MFACGQRRLLSNSVVAQTSLSLRWVQMSESTLSFHAQIKE